MRILLTNDDGIDAPGIAALHQVAREFGECYWVAPLRPWSGCGHQVTTKAPIPYFRRSERVWAVDGFPADCVRVALTHLTPDIDLVLSGINDGGNLGVDVFISGTVAAAREGVILGKQAIAFSQYRAKNTKTTWEVSASYAEKVIREWLSWRESGGLKQNRIWNANFPDLTRNFPNASAEEIAERSTTVAIRHVPLETGPLAVAFEHNDGSFHYSGVYHDRSRAPDTDVDTCFDGSIAVTELPLS